MQKQALGEEKGLYIGCVEIAIQPQYIVVAGVFRRKRKKTKIPWFFQMNGWFDEI